MRLYALSQALLKPVRVKLWGILSGVQRPAPEPKGKKGWISTKIKIEALSLFDLPIPPMHPVSYAKPNQLATSWTHGLKQVCMNQSQEGFAFPIGRCTLFSFPHRTL